ncbi:MAG: DUF2061 domain-containing protein [Candidatus Bathyarchaeales archaeon]
MEKPIRSLVKAISWRIVATLTTILLVVLFSKGDWSLGGIVGISELVLKTVVYYFHERVWNMLGFGREAKC